MSLKPGETPSCGRVSPRSAIAARKALRVSTSRRMPAAATCIPEAASRALPVGGLSDDAWIELFPVGENRFPRELGLAKVRRLTDADVLVEHESPANS